VHCERTLRRLARRLHDTATFFSGQ